MNNMPVFDAEVVDKSMIVIGSFAADSLDDAKRIVRDMPTGVGSFRGVDIALADFDTPQGAMQFVRSQNYITITHLKRSKQILFPDGHVSAKKNAVQSHTSNAANKSCFLIATFQQGKLHHNHTPHTQQTNPPNQIDPGYLSILFDTCNRMSSGWGITSLVALGYSVCHHVAEMWRSGKRICLLRLKCVIVMRFSLLKRGDQEGGFVCCV